MLISTPPALRCSSRNATSVAVYPDNPPASGSAPIFPFITVVVFLRAVIAVHVSGPLCTEIIVEANVTTVTIVVGFTRSIVCC
jgi:hypothetical protein